MGGFRLLSLILLPIIACSASQEAVGDQAMNSILTASYNKESVPQKSLKEPVPLSLSFQLWRVVDFDSANLAVTLNIMAVHKWTDFRLKWDPALANGVKMIRVPSEKLWVPDVMVYNGVNAGLQYFTKTVVMNNGTVIWVPPVQFSVPCVPAGEGSFNCTAEAGSWTYDGTIIDLIENTFLTDMLAENPRFSVSKPTAVKFVKHYSCCEEPYESVKFSFLLGVK